MFVGPLYNSKASKSLEVSLQGRKVAEEEGQRITKLLAESREECAKNKADVQSLQKSLEAQARVCGGGATSQRADAGVFVLLLHSTR